MHRVGVLRVDQDYKVVTIVKGEWLRKEKWAYLESNQGPRAYQARALTV